MRRPVLLLVVSLCALTAAEFDRAPWADRALRPAALPAGAARGSLREPPPAEELARLRALVDHALLEQAALRLALLLLHYQSTPELQRESLRLERRRERELLLRRVRDAQTFYRAAPGQRLEAGARSPTRHALADATLLRLFRDADPSAFVLLLGAVLDPARPRVSRAMLRLLGRTGDARSSPLLLQVARANTRPAALRGEAIDSLARLGRAEDGRALLGVLRHPDSQLSARALRACLLLLRDQFEAAFSSLLQQLDQATRRALEQRIGDWTASRVLGIAHLLDQQRHALALEQVHLLRWLRPRDAGAALLEARCLLGLGTPPGDVVRMLLPFEGAGVDGLLVSLCDRHPWPVVAGWIARSHAPAERARWAALCARMRHPEARR